MTLSKFKKIIFKSSFLLSAFTQLTVYAQELTIVVPYAQLGPSDAAMRAVAKNMAINYPNGVKVENKLGDSGLLGLREFAEKSEVDSKLILLNSNTFYMAASKEPKLLDSIRPVSLISLSPMVLVSNKSWNALVKDAISNKSIKLGVSSPGSASHLCALQIAEAIGVEPQLVIYKGTGPLMADLLAQNVDACLETSSSVSTYLKSGKFSIIALTDEAALNFPNIPTFESLGVKNITKGQWAILASLAKSSEKFNADAANSIRLALQSKLDIPDGIFNFVPANVVTNQIAVNFVQRDFVRTKPYLNRLAN